jgi:RimJ/RimL family protein N-acetyltransferase
VEICQTRDAELIRTIVTHESIYPTLTHDGAPPPDRWDSTGLAAAEGMHFLVPRVEAGATGLYLFHQMNAVMCEVQVGILPKYRHRSLEASILAFNWVFTHTDYHKIIAYAPISNRPSRNLCAAVGMTVEGLLTESCQIGGKLLDQELYGFGKRAFMELHARR